MSTPAKLDKSSTRPYALLREFLEELEWSPTKKYVELLRHRGDLLEIDEVDVDVPQIVKRRFTCDASRCIQWMAERPLVDRSCCCRYDVPLTRRDREAVTAHMEEVREILPDGHRLLDPEADPFVVSDDLGLEMIHDNLLGGCQFNLYREGKCRCAIHSAALEAGADPLEWKPLACSLWPLAVNAYDDDGEDRLLLTVYCVETAEVFEEIDEDPFACIEDQDPGYPPLYRAERATLEHLFGKAFYRKLDQAAARLLAAEERSLIG
jgi:hypothetical protein